MTRRAAAAAAPPVLPALSGACLFALSTAAAGSAALAWHPAATRPRWLVSIAGLTALAMILADEAPGWTSRLRAWFRGGPGLAHVLYAAAAVLTLLSLFGPPTAAMLRRAVLGFGLVQVLLLATSGGGRERTLVLINALMLTLLATLAGGPLAAIAAISFATLLVAFLVFDHFARRLAWFGAPEAGFARLALREVLPRSLAVAAGLGLYFWLDPPVVLAGVRVAPDGPVVDPEQLARAQVRLLLVGLAGAGLVYAIHRARRRRKQRPQPQVELPLAERGVEEPLERSEPRLAATGSDLRRRVVRAYAELLRAARRDLRRRPGDTSTALSARVRSSAGPVAALTRLFSQARYGPLEPSREDAVSAELASEASIVELRTRGVPRPDLRSGSPDARRRR